jgi:hypothetical protein
MQQQGNRKEGREILQVSLCGCVVSLMLPAHILSFFSCRKSLLFLSFFSRSKEMKPAAFILMRFFAGVLSPSISFSREGDCLQTKQNRKMVILVSISRVGWMCLFSLFVSAAACVRRT